MALITRCPVCGTQFKVVPDQLRISEGWVRCGQCAEVFDASTDLEQGELEVAGYQVPGSFADPVPETVPVPEAVLFESPLQESLHPTFPNLSPAEPESFTNYLHVEPVTVPLPQDVWPVIPERVAEVTSVQENVSDEKHVPELVQPGEGTLPDTVTASEAVDDTLPLPVVFEPEPSVELLADRYSFARTPAPATRGQTQLVRWVAWSCVGLLAVLLGLQMLFYGRDRVAASWPVSKPWLQSGCRLLGCSVQPLRHIESIAIDSSSLSATHNDAYRLSLVLKNHAMVDLAMPALEFVLTDGDEQALVRRVLSPSDFGGVSRVLFAGREWATTVDLQVLDEPMKTRVVGYRLLAFYP